MRLYHTDVLTYIREHSHDSKSRASAPLESQLSVFRTSKTQAASKDSLPMSALSLVKEDRVRVVPVP